MRFTLALFLLMLAACSASGPVYQAAPAAPEGKGIVYLYRPAGGPWGGRDTHFYINDVNVADLGNNAYTWFYLPEGSYTIRQRWSIDISAQSTELPVFVKAGSVSYVRMGIRTGNISDVKLMGIIPTNTKQIDVIWQLTAHSHDGAIDELEQCRFQAPNDDKLAAIGSGH